MFKWVSILWQKVLYNFQVTQIHPENVITENNTRETTRRQPIPVVTNLYCPICLQSVDTNVASYCKNTPCNAHYHRQCIEQWMEYNRGTLTCTLCTLPTVCLRPKKKRKPKRNKNRIRASNPITVFIQPSVTTSRQSGYRTQRPRVLQDITPMLARHRLLNRQPLSSRNNTVFRDSHPSNNHLIDDDYNRIIQESINLNRRDPSYIY